MNRKQKQIARRERIKKIAAWEIQYEHAWQQREQQIEQWAESANEYALAGTDDRPMQPALAKLPPHPFPKKIRQPKPVRRSGVDSIIPF